MNGRKETPQERWQKKSGYISKSFKMYRSLADGFAEACAKAGVPQSAKIAELMQGFIDETEGLADMAGK